MRSKARSESKGGAEVGSLEPKFHPFEKKIRLIAESLLRETKNENSSLQIYLVGEKTMNKNVLSFPAPKRFPHPDAPGSYLGEIYLNPDYINNHGENLYYMLVHGFLHLLGYVHERKDARIAMERRERVLMRKLKLPS